MRTLIGLLLCALLAGPVWGREPPGPEQLVQQALRRLRHRDVVERLGALAALEQLLVAHPELGPRCVPWLGSALRREAHTARARIMTLLGLIPGEAARGLWLERLDPEVEADDRVLAAAVDAARLRSTDTAAQRALVKLVRAERLDPVRRALLYEALGFFDGPVVLVALADARSGKASPSAPEPWVEAAGRALGLGNRRDDASMPPLLGLLAHPDRAVVMAAWEGLVERTKQPLGPDAQAWRAWWAKQQQPAPPPAAAPAGDDGHEYAPPRHVHVPTYYTVPIPRPRSKVVFCLDVSQSMYGDGIRDARRHLTRTLLDLPGTHAFDIVAFNERIFPFAGRIVRAHPTFKWRAVAWLGRLEPTSYTNLYDAVETAFQYMGRGRAPAAEPVVLDMVFLLSDGAPNRGRFRNEERVVKHIGRLSRRDVPVHTVAAGDRVFQLLQRIAEATGGSFVDAFE